jgi:hypothetical protein
MPPGAESSILVCRCGRRLKAAGATPGRVGRCPSCGATFRVGEANSSGSTPTLPPKPTRPSKAPAPAEAEEGEGGGYGVLPATVSRPPTFVAAPVASRRPEPGVDLSTADRRGLVSPPDEPESRIRDSLLYPLWDAPGLGYLAFMPPMLWLTSLLSFGLIPSYVIGQGEVVAMGAMTMIFPMGCLFALAMGRALIYLEQVLASSSHGDLHHPRWPTWDFFAMITVWFRWLGAIVLGFTVPGLLALVYWVYAGDLGLADWVILGTLLTGGAAYTAMALVAVILHADLWAANPFTVLGALRRVGGDYLRVCLFAWVSAGAVILAARGLFALPGLVLPVLAVWLFWVAVLYVGMVVLRAVGLCYRRHASALGWFPERRRGA